MEHSQVAEYLAHLAGQDRAERTIAEYGKVLRDLLEHSNWGDASLSRVITPQIEGDVASPVNEDTVT